LEAPNNSASCKSLQGVSQPLRARSITPEEGASG